MKILPITKEVMHSQMFVNFISRFEENFKVNSQLNEKPWCYRALPNFFFYMLNSQTDVYAVMVKSMHDKNEHLNFLYVDTEHRSTGHGKTLLEFWLSNAGRPLLTIHVKRDLQRTQAFYASMGFTVADISNPQDNLRPWIDKALAFSAETYDDAVLMWRRAAEPDRTR